MNEDTKALIESYYRAFNDGNRAQFLSLLIEDVTHDINQGHREVGLEAFGAFFDHMEECYAEQIRDIVVMTDASGTRAAAEFMVHGTYTKTDSGLPPAAGQRYILPAGAFFTVQDGKVARISNTYNLNEWLRQIGG